MKDVTDKADIARLVSAFYEKVRSDAMLSPVFKHVDWEHHTPIIIDFWCMALLGDTSYKGNPFAKHVPLRLEGEHFGRWLKLFGETIDENFEGEKAEEAKARAVNIARLFRFKLGLTAPD
ncbi:MAG TPA: group III truncated hemoglobin [Chryseosolibacter sp.]|nr:group III truncated hemoglobin [Chryseosolibacter sp.]